ncbi:cytochrome P450 [Spirillospora sp. NPDC049024]
MSARDIAHPATYAAGVPYAEFARRRREEPVGRVEEPLLVRHSSAGRIAQRGTGYWAVMSHAAVQEASRRPEVFSSAAKGAFLTDPRSRADLVQARQLLVNMDAPEHLRLRRLITAVFTPRAVRALAGSVRAHAAALAERAAAAERFDAVADLAAELPLLVLAGLLGVDEADRHLLYRWSNNLVGFDDPEYGGGDIDVYRATFAEAFGYALRLRARRRAEPAGDLIGRLAAADLSDREFCNFWLLLVVAGNETTRHLISGSLQALAAFPEQRDALAAGEVPMADAVEELIRWVTPIMQFRRTATRDTELAGARIRGGDKVVLYYASANRDEAVFTAPDRLDLSRRPNPHLAFGVGPHFCLGAHLARLELAELLTALRPHLRRFEPVGPAVRLESNFVNGVKSLPARFAPR